MRPLAPILIACLALTSPAAAQTTALPPVLKVRNYLPHMTRPEVEDLLTRSDMVIIPVASLEQHGTHLPIGTDYLNGVERAKRIAQRADVLVAPILLPGQSPYHMGFAGTVTLPSTLIQEVYVESVKSLIRHGFKRFLILNAHGGNRAITTFIVDRINQETAGIAVDLGAVCGSLHRPDPGGDRAEPGDPSAGSSRRHRRDLLVAVPDPRIGGHGGGGACPPHDARASGGNGAPGPRGRPDRACPVPGRGPEGRIDGEGYLVGRDVEHRGVGRSRSGRRHRRARPCDDRVVRRRGGRLHRALERAASGECSYNGPRSRILTKPSSDSRRFSDIERTSITGYRA